MTIWGITGKNKEQQDAIIALMDKNIDLVVLSGKAGSGKTLLTLAAGLEQVVEKKRYDSIIFTRAPVPVGAELGYLPGTIDEKLAPWCGALFDNLSFLNVVGPTIERYVDLIALQHLRGRSLINKYVIIDECSNLTLAQLKVIITRAGEGSKFILLGDPDQVDNRSLTKENNGLTLLLDTIHNSHSDEHISFIRVVELLQCERSRLAEWGSDFL